MLFCPINPHQSRQQQQKQELNSAANVIENSENPQQSTEKFREGDDVTYIDYNEELNSCKISK